MTPFSKRDASILRRLMAKHMDDPVNFNGIPHGTMGQWLSRIALCIEERVNPPALQVQGLSAKTFLGMLRPQPAVFVFEDIKVPAACIEMDPLTLGYFYGWSRPLFHSLEGLLRTEFDEDIRGRCDVREGIYGSDHTVVLDQDGRLEAKYGVMGDPNDLPPELRQSSLLLKPVPILPPQSPG